MDEVKDKLEKCNTLNEVFAVLDEYYDLDQRLGVISKSLLLNSVPNIILMTGAKKRKSLKEHI